MHPRRRRRVFWRRPWRNTGVVQPPHPRRQPKGNGFPFGLLMGIGLTIVLSFGWVLFAGGGKEAIERFLENVTSSDYGSSEVVTSVPDGDSAPSRDSGFAGSVEDPTPKVDCRTEGAERGRDDEWSHQSVDVMDLEVSVGSSRIDLSGTVIARCKASFSSAERDDQSTFAIYRHPKPSGCVRGLPCPATEPIASILEPLSPGWYYEESSDPDVIADSWMVLRDSIRVSFKPHSRWGSKFYVGVWGWDVERSRPAHLAEALITLPS